MIDSGIRWDHSDFGGRVSLGFDAYGGNGNEFDCYSHGTHTAGIVGGATSGVAKGVSLVSVRVLGCDNTGPTSGIIAGLDWVTAHHKAQLTASPLASAVANMSLGGGASIALDTAVQNMMFSGVVTVIAAGNQNADACNYSPSRVTNAMTIGSSDSADVKAASSSYGNCLDMFAPGVGILSASNLDNSSFRLGGGTSMAAPHVAGVAAIYLQNHPGSSQIQVRDALLGYTTKGAVTNSLTANNHLLFNAESPQGTGDYMSPSTAITSPPNGASLQRNKSIAIQASASDVGGGVTRVEFYVDGTLKCTDTAAPYSCTWNVPPNPKGAIYTWQTKAFDSAGNAQASPFASFVAK